MTTIAWDGEQMAADSLGITANMKYKVKKIFRLMDGRIAAIAGDFGDGLKVVDWLNDGGEKPYINSDDLVVLVADKDGLIRYETSLMPIPINEPFHAAGSGRDYAMAAMHLGRDADTAVSVAKEFDVGTGGEIIALRPDNDD